MTYVLGVDLGTTTVAAATGDAERVEMVSLGDRSVLAPAVVARRADGSIVTGDRAARRAATEPERVASEVRRRLGDPTPVMLGERAEPATDLLAAMLRDVLARAVAVRGGRPSRVVLTHPGSWGPYRRGLFEDVAAAAGLPGAVTMPDAEAAVRQVAVSRGLDPAAPTAVLDLGGTSCEATVVRGGTVVGTPVAVERLGGADLDDAVSAFVDEASGGLLVELDPDDPSSGPALARFRADCVAAKEALSVDDEVGVPLLLPGRHLDLTLSRAAFEQRIAAVPARAVDALRQALDAASVRPEDLAAVLLVGGSARVPLLARTVREALAAPVVVEARPDHVVALGAVRRGADLAAHRPGDAGGDEDEDGRTSLTPMRPREAAEDDRTTTVRTTTVRTITGPVAGPAGTATAGPGPRATPRATGTVPGAPTGPFRAGGPGLPTGPFPGGGPVPGDGPIPGPGPGPGGGPVPGGGPFPGGPRPTGPRPTGPFRAPPPGGPGPYPPGRPYPGEPVRPAAPPPPAPSGRNRTLLVVGIAALVLVALVVAVVLLSGG